MKATTANPSLNFNFFEYQTNLLTQMQETLKNGLNGVPKNFTDSIYEQQSLLTEHLHKNLNLVTTNGFDYKQLSDSHAKLSKTILDLNTEFLKNNFPSFFKGL